MATFIRTSDATVTTDDSEVNLLAINDDLIVGREATLVAAGVNTVVVRGIGNHSMLINGELLSLGDAILTSAGGNRITIGVDGVVASAEAEALQFGAGSNVIFNSGQIAGQLDGIDIIGGSNRITNDGQISGQAGEAITIDGANNRITNHGGISGVNDDGIFISGDGGNFIVNTGTISGVGDDGVDMDGLANSTNRLVNSGTISTDSSDSYNGGVAIDIVLNSGLMIGDVDLQSGNDRLNSRFGIVDGDVEGGAGDDTLIGGAGEDALFGNADDDVLRGNGGEDLLDGGDGRDTLAGGDGDDFFQFTSTPVGPNADKILDFIVKDDTIQLDDADFAGLSVGALAVSAFRVGATASDANDRIIYNAANGGLFFDADGNGAGAQVKIANLDKNLAMTNEDFFVI